MTGRNTLRDTLEKRLAAGGDDALLRFTLGNAYLREGDLATAIIHLKAAVTHKPDYSAAWALLGTVCLKYGAGGAAVDAWTHGIKAAEEKGDLQAFRQMTTLLAKLERRAGQPGQPDQFGTYREFPLTDAVQAIAAAEESPRRGATTLVSHD
jgi:predicted Zn-dependent protease